MQNRPDMYMTGPHVNCTPVNGPLSTFGSIQGRWKAYDAYPAPSPLRRSLTTIPWSPSVYYSTAKVNHGLASDQKLPEPQFVGSHMSQLDGVKTPGLFSAARTALYTRYTPSDWLRHKHAISADQVRAEGALLRSETNRLASELDDKTKRTTADAGRRLGERVSDIKFWKSELGAETGAMLTEMENLRKTRQALETFLRETDDLDNIAKECLYQREKRQGIDLVHDNAESSLITEIDLIKRVREMAQAHLDQTNAQLSLSRAAQHEMEKDSRDKHVADTIDSAAFNLKETSRGVALHRGVERFDNTVTVPESWGDFTNGNIHRSQAERTASRNVRNDVQNTLNHATQQLWGQWNKVNTELGARIRETMEARNKIQKHLAGALQEIFDTERNVHLLKKAIEDKVNPLKVATTRLDNRLHRPNMEACRDSAHSRLVQEVHEIDESIESLTNQLRRTENQHQVLLRKRSALEHDLAIKNNTLFLDGEKCMGMRRTYPLQDRVWQLI